MELIIALIPALASIITVLITERRTMHKMDAQQAETLQYVLKTDIQGVYAMYKDAKEIPQAVWEGICGMYDKYTSVGGNSYITGMKNEMSTWRKL